MLKKWLADTDNAANAQIHMLSKRTKKSIYASMSSKQATSIDRTAYIYINICEANM